MTELIWEGKYSKDGKKQGPVRIALPFQTIETVNESAQERQRSLEMFASGREAEWRNRLIWGDKKYVLPSLLPEFAGKVNLIYIDPPFDTGADFSFTAMVPGLNEKEEELTAFLKEPSILEQKAYRDTWGRGLESYLEWLYEASSFLHELLHETGAMYVHLDWRLVHYARVLLDEVFGNENFMSNIVWKRIASGRKAKSNKWLAVDDIMLVYTKGNHKVNQIYLPYSDEYKKRFIHQDERGPYFWDNIGTYSEARLRELEAEGRIRYPDNPNAKPRVKNYLWEGKGVIVDNIWTDIPPVNSQAAEDTGYPTQKPEALLERTIRASSKEGDLLLDCFVGSGTSAVTAEKLKRRWIVSDFGRFAVHTTRKRLLGIPNVTPFVVQNLGKYERQAWQAAEFPGNGRTELQEQRSREAAYRKFILDLYHATPVTGHVWLHGAKGGRMVHVGAVDAPVTISDVKAIAQEVWKSAGKGKEGAQKPGVDILGWEFALEINETAKQTAAEARVDVSFKKIPREVLEKKAVEQGDIRFFELGALSVDTKQKGGELRLELSNFLIPVDDIPEEVRKAVKHWSQIIDYWAVDWDYKDDTFHNQWQSYRTRKDPKIELSARCKYAAPGKYSVVVKVIDILGNDTTKTLQVEVR